MKGLLPVPVPLKETNPLYLTTQQVADRFHLHRRTIYRWAARKSERYPAPLRIGGKYLWPLDAIKLFEKKAKQPGIHR